MARKKRPHKTSPKTPSRVKKRRGAQKPRAARRPSPSRADRARRSRRSASSSRPCSGSASTAARSRISSKAASASRVPGAGRLRAARRADRGAQRARRRPPVPARARRALLGLLLTLGRGHGGAVGGGLESVVALGLGTTGATILGVLLTIAGVLFLTGASPRRDPPPLRARRPRARTRACARRGRRSARRRDAEPALRALRPRRRPSTSSTTTPTSSPTPPGPAAALFHASRTRPTSETPRAQETLFAPLEPRRRIHAPRPRAPARLQARRAARTREASQRVAEALVTCLANFGVDATVIGQISGPRVTRYELQLAPGHEGRQGRPAEGRPELRARDDRDPHPRADPRQAGGGRRGAEPQPEPGHARRHLRRGARRPRARSRSGSARTSPARRSGPTSRACRTC